MTDLQSAALPAHLLTEKGSCDTNEEALTRSLHGATDPDLARLCLAWPMLPDHIKVAILALMNTGR
jgi:hypothetical protein